MPLCLRRPQHHVTLTAWLIIASILQLSLDTTDAWPLLRLPLLICFFKLCQNSKICRHIDLKCLFHFTIVVFSWLYFIFSLVVHVLFLKPFCSNTETLSRSVLILPSNFCLLRLLTWREPWKRQEKRKGRSTSFRKVVGVHFKVNSCLYAVTKRKKKLCLCSWWVRSQASANRSTVEPRWCEMLKETKSDRDELQIRVSASNFFTQIKL